MPTPSALLAMLIFGSIGLAAFIYGKNDRLPKPMLLGAALMIYPYFVTGDTWLWGVGGVLATLIFFTRD